MCRRYGDVDSDLAGQYSVTVSNAFDCSTSATVQVIGVALPDAHISGSTTVCEGSSLTLVATGGTEYRWSEGTVSDTLVVTPTESTTYWVTVTNQYGCAECQTQFSIYHVFRNNCHSNC